MKGRLSYLALLINSVLSLKMTITILALPALILSFSLYGGIETVKRAVLVMIGQIPPESTYEWLVMGASYLIKLIPVIGAVELTSLGKEGRMKLKASSMYDHIILVGLGHLGRRVASLLQSLGVKFVVIVLPEDRESEPVGEHTYKGVPIIFGDARSAVVLREAGVKRASTLISTVDDDLTNTVIAERAKEENPSIKVVARVYRDEIGQVLKSSGKVDVVFSTSDLVHAVVTASALFPVEMDVPIPVPMVLNEEVRRLVRKGLASPIALLGGGKWKPVSSLEGVKEGSVLLMQLALTGS